MIKAIQIIEAFSDSFSFESPTKYFSNFTHFHPESAKRQQKTAIITYFTDQIGQNLNFFLVGIILLRAKFFLVITIDDYIAKSLNCILFLLLECLKFCEKTKIFVLQTHQMLRGIIISFQRP